MKRSKNTHEVNVDTLFFSFVFATFQLFVASLLQGALISKPSQQLHNWGQVSSMTHSARVQCSFVSCSQSSVKLSGVDSTAGNLF